MSYVHVCPFYPPVLKRHRQGNHQSKWRSTTGKILEQTTTWGFPPQASHVLAFQAFHDQRLHVFYPALQICVQCRGQLNDLKDLSTLAFLKDLAGLRDAVLTSQK